MGGMDSVGLRIGQVAGSFVCCNESSALRLADHSSRGVLPTVMRRCE